MVQHLASCHHIAWLRKISSTKRLTVIVFRHHLMVLLCISLVSQGWLVSPKRTLRYLSSCSISHHLLLLIEIIEFVMRLILHWVHHPIASKKSSWSRFLISMVGHLLGVTLNMLWSCGFNIRYMVSTIFYYFLLVILQLTHLSIHLGLSWCFIHSLAHQYVHKKHWLLLNTLWRHFLAQILITLTSMMWWSTRLLSYVLVI